MFIRVGQYYTVRSIGLLVGQYYTVMAICVGQNILYCNAQTCIILYLMLLPQGSAPTASEHLPAQPSCRCELCLLGKQYINDLHVKLRHV